MNMPKSYSFLELDRVPDRPGLYAWYSKFTLSPADTKGLQRDLAGESEEGKRQELVRKFLASHLFRPLEETPYKVDIGGRLKPAYTGTAHHVHGISGSLVQRLAEDHSRVDSLNAVLGAAVPFFASPIYIGVATGSLRQRLMRHQYLIEKYWDEFSLTDLDDGVSRDAEEGLDHSFAREVAQLRRLHPDSLLVYALALSDVTKLTVVDAENVLNRINYPLCGRN